ncbi:MAG: fumarylacetoacetate hydrolase family protein [Candidatus Sumerlaeaceae bacterium]|nr:fumarylacetoacetate hydrolase family protein [Candidatus Sumerlaeaceae bacterium]
MKIFRFEARGVTRLGFEVGPLIYDIAQTLVKLGKPVPQALLDADLKGLLTREGTGFFEKIEAELEDMTLARRADETSCFEVPSVKILAPIGDPGKIICIGLNYKDHCTEQNKEAPPYPMLFSKFANTVRATDETIPMPTTTEKLDFEGELGVVIGKRGFRVKAENALSHVFGYTVIHDVSARDLQKSDGQWLRAKGQDGFAPMGPCIVTADEIGDPQTLGIRTKLNGQVMQDSNTGQMIFPVTELIRFITEGITLEPGDIISTGTPSGVGAHRKPPVFLKVGDRVEVEVEKIGRIVNTVAAS